MCNEWARRNFAEADGPLNADFFIVSRVAEEGRNPDGVPGSKLESQMLETSVFSVYDFFIFFRAKWLRITYLWICEAISEKYYNKLTGFCSNFPETVAAPKRQAYDRLGTPKQANQRRGGTRLSFLHLPTGGPTILPLDPFAIAPPPTSLIPGSIERGCLDSRAEPVSALPSQNLEIPRSQVCCGKAFCAKSAVMRMT